MIWGISVIEVSLIAVPSLILSTKPNAKELLEKVEPYQGWIGLIFCFGRKWVTTALLNIGWLASSPIWWITLLPGNIFSTTLAVMLGFGLINKYFLSKNEAAKAKAEELRTKITPKQGKLGILGPILGLLIIIASFIFMAS